MTVNYSKQSDTQRRQAQDCSLVLLKQLYAMRPAPIILDHAGIAMSALSEHETTFKQVPIRID